MQSRIIRASLAVGLAFLFLFPSWSAANVNSWLGFPALFFFFLSFAAALLGWGSLLARPLGGGLAEIFLGASVVGVVFTLVPGFAGWLHFRALFFAILFVGLWFLPIERWLAPPALSRWVIALFAFVLGLRTLAAFLPQGHGDPLLYHLAGPALWAEAGRVHLNSDLPNVMLSASWEYLYLWPQIFFRPAGLNGQIAAQIFSQWIHLFWGWLGLAVLVARIARRFTLSEGRKFLFPFAGIFVASLQWTAGVAKNDSGVAFWSLGAWLLLSAALESGAASAATLVGAGLLAGLAITGKISAVIFLAPFLSVAVLWHLWRAPMTVLRKAIICGVTLLLTLLPIYVRNWIETGNPFFPMFATYFPSPWVSASWEAHFSVVQPTEHMSWWALFTER